MTLPLVSRETMESSWRVFEPWRTAPGAPPVDVVARDREYVVTADLPGVGRGDVRVEVSDRSLRITTTRPRDRADPARYRRRERRREPVDREIGFPRAVVPGRTTARLREGVLTVTLPVFDPPVNRVEVT